MSVAGPTAAELRVQILGAAAAEFMAKGYAQTTVNTIAKRLGATKGLIYYHYESKFDLFLGIFEYGMTDSLAALRPLRGEGGTGRETLWLMSVEHVVRLMSGIESHYVIQQGVRESRSLSLRPDQREALRRLNRLRDDYEDMFREVLASGVDDESLRHVDVKLATRTLLSSLNSVVDWYRPTGDDSYESRRKLAVEVVDLVLRGLHD